MENSNRPEVGEYAAQLAKLCDVRRSSTTLTYGRHGRPGMIIDHRFGASLEHEHATTGLPLWYAVGGRGET